jgi:hypothetical protein
VSGVVPAGAAVTEDGALTPASKALLQELVTATGGSWKIRLSRVNDTTVALQMLGSDGVWRAVNLTLS